jgi:outer membrane lipoprotein-sorting protein
MKKGLVLFIVWFCFWFSVLESALADGNAAPKLSLSHKEFFLIKLEDNLKTSTTIQAKFIQEKHLSLFNDALISKGVFAFAAPDRLRWEVTQPFHSLLVMNGREVAKYDFPDGKNPHRLKFPAADALSAVLTQIADMHQGKFGAEEKNYDIEIYRGKTVSMTLVPKDPKMKRIIPKIELTFSKALDSVASVVIRENGGDFTRIVFDENEHNPNLSDSLFSIQ